MESNNHLQQQHGMDEWRGWMNESIVGSADGWTMINDWKDASMDAGFPLTPKILAVFTSLGILCLQRLNVSL